jgi:DNA-binding HxlR family transcriptional regulator
MAETRSYGDACGIARGLDLVGERWALLVVRELLRGPKRFSDLRVGLPTASPNVLSRRLRELEEGGVVRRRRLGPPASTWAYELTEHGYELEPVLLALARWGSRTPLTSAADLSADALMLALETTFDPSAAGDLDATYEVRLGEDRFRVEVGEGRIDVRRGTTTDAAAVLETSAATLRALTLGGRSLDDALVAGEVRLAGDRDAARRLLGSFFRPAAA